MISQTPFSERERLQFQLLYSFYNQFSGLAWKSKEAPRIRSQRHRLPFRVMVMEISVEVSTPAPVQRGVEVSSTDARLMRASVGGPPFALWMRGSTLPVDRGFVLSPL